MHEIREDTGGVVFLTRQTPALQPEAVVSHATSDSEAVVSHATSDSEAVVSHATSDSEAVVSHATSNTEAVVSHATSNTEAVVSDATSDSEAVVSDATSNSEAVCVYCRIKVANVLGLDILMGVRASLKRYEDQEGQEHEGQQPLKTHIAVAKYVKDIVCR
ncbi:cell wall synthesis protein Wag31-like [Procambarus clarkii]|uniref:cell wall synthesis protein Wag31-like n=1 Tax=Procambarus clarkii TaxID=6728 RepID=UPI003742DCED